MEGLATLLMLGICTFASIGFGGGGFAGQSRKRYKSMD
jgi:hypothetical protein